MTKWQRVTKRTPCPVCHKPDWCLSMPGKALCMRVESKRTVNFKNGDRGWYHELAMEFTAPPVRPKDARQTVIDPTKILQGFRAGPQRPMEGLAGVLGVSETALTRLGFVWAEEYRAWAVPMRNGSGSIVGIRLRRDDGSKFAVRGSHEGSFIPFLQPSLRVLICEGATDTAAALSLGYYAIGRPSARSGIPDAVLWTATRGITRAVIISDNDGVGLDGAKRLSEHLTIPSCTVVLPCKDLRKFCQLGGDRVTLDSLIDATVWTTR